MKKGLMTTSALVAAGMFGLASQADAQMMRKPNPVQLKVGGYMEQFVAYSNVDIDNLDGDAATAKPGDKGTTEEGIVHPLEMHDIRARLHNRPG